MRKALVIVIALIIGWLVNAWMRGISHTVTWEADVTATSFEICVDGRCQTGGKPLQGDIWTAQVRLRPGAHIVGVKACNRFGCSTTSETPVAIWWK